jgi:hypothetical protein
MSESGIGAALRRAFLWHWHLLGLGAGAGFALLSGDPTAWLAIVAAGELAYMGFLGLHPRFQNVLLGQKLIGSAGPPVVDASARVQQIASFLTPENLDRFQKLQSRCSGLLSLRRSMDARESDLSSENFRGESLDRMLWLCLKLLHQKSGLERFLSSTERAEIERELHSSEEQMQAAKTREEAAGHGVPGRLTTSIGERIKTIRERLENYDKAAESLELVGAEIEKTEQQITHLCEVGLTMRDSAGLSAQIDGISESLQSSEKAFAHASVDALFDDEAAPPLLSGSVSGLPPALPADRKAVKH